MTSADTEAMTALQELLDERQRYEGWIVALEQRESTTAPHVYGRVHTDYTLRLERVLHRLSERTEQLQSTVQLTTSRLVALRSREADRIDARQEAELRAVVGEYTDEEWTTLRDDADREITSITEERRGVEVELAEIERIVDMTRATQVEIAEPPVTKAEGDASVGEEQVPVSGDSSPSIQNFVAGQPLRIAEPTPQVVSSSKAPEGDKSQVTFSLGLPQIPADVPASPVLEARREQEKSLKCPECGGLNYATEWYCERCGGELATF